jgi:hypothetical protein
MCEFLCDLFKNLDRLSLGFPDGMKINLSRCSVLMAKKALDRAYIYIGPIQDRSPQVPESMKTKIPNFCVLA